MPSSHVRSRSSRFSGRESRGIVEVGLLESVNLNFPIQKGRTFEFVKFQRSLMNNLAYFGIFYSRIFERGLHDYNIVGGTPIGSFLYWILHINVTIKCVFLAFLVTDSTVKFLDQITMLDYILCAVIVYNGTYTFFLRYPFYETLQSLWKILNSIYWKHGCPPKIRTDMERLQKQILATHMVIVFGGCAALMIQYFPEPKYVNYTYSTFEFDNWPLRIIFGAHEYCFLMMSWNAYAGASTMTIYQGVAISKIIDQLNATLLLLYKDEMKAERVMVPGVGCKFRIKKNFMLPQKMVPDTEYNIDGIILDYKKLMLICERFNNSVAYNTLFLHICGVAQFTSDVFAGMHTLRLPGARFSDVWFYVWDSMSAGFMLLRVYQFMGLVYDSSEIFLATLKEYFTFQNARKPILRRMARTLRIVSLNVGPCKVMTETVLGVLDVMGNYYVCAALW